MAKIKINKDVLQKSLSALSCVIPSKEIISFDGVFRFDFKKDHATVYAINSRAQMSSYVKCDSSEDVSFCVYNRTIRDIVRTFPDGEIVIQTSGEQVAHINIAPEGQKKKYKLACVSDHGFPSMPEVSGGEKVVFPAGFLQKTLKTISAYCDAGNVITSFANINIYPINEKLCFVSGSQYLIHIIKTSERLKNSYIIPRETEKYLSFMSGIDNCEITFSASVVKIDYSGFKIFINLIEGTSSNYKMLMDQEPLSEPIIFDKKIIAESTSRLAIFSDVTERVIIHAKNDECELKCLNEEFGNEGVEVIQTLSKETKEDTFAIKHSIISKVCHDSDGESISIRRNDSMGFARPENADQLWIIGLSTV